MFSWKVLWSIVLILTETALVALWNASISAWTAAFGTASDWLDPRLTVPEAAPVLVPPFPPQAASSDGAASSVPAPRAPRSRVRRLTPPTEAGTRLARQA